MSASVNTAPAQAAGWGRFPTTLAALALVVILAVAVAIVALNGTKAAPAATGAKGAPPPAVIDHSYSSGDINWGRSVTNVPFYDHGWSSAETYELPTYVGPFVNHENPGKGVVAPENTGSRPRNQ